ncbi:cystatin-1 isoform X2 [Tetranychus urticae]|uniref:cystatin-1 isoform X2 n=1 Tax=Tetranychus urticae TaxID=32264 RepID=UPI00077C0466|nr:cystatin-1 isoform X2 [Tetranychus urticae]
MKLILVIAVCLIGASHQFILDGGWGSVDANSETIKDLAQVATEHRNSQINSLYYRTLVEIKSAKQQVVNGMKYELTLVLADTNCAKQDAGAKLCPVGQGAAKEECVYTIWIESTKEAPEVTSSSCTDL